jgi:hypothetical protein
MIQLAIHQPCRLQSPRTGRSEPPCLSTLIRAPPPAST